MGHTKITIYVKKKKIKADLPLTYCQQAHVPGNNEHTFFQHGYTIRWLKTMEESLFLLFLPYCVLIWLSYKLGSLSHQEWWVQLGSTCSQNPVFIFGKKTKQKQNHSHFIMSLSSSVYLKLDLLVSNRMTWNSTNLKQVFWEVCKALNKPTHTGKCFGFTWKRRKKNQNRKVRLPEKWFKWMEKKAISTTRWF